ncbi:MAG: hypothetical protein PHG19_12360 [Anaerotignum sp.]|nr:hypothetical protein [Anaerotignum sp.]
MLDLTEMNGIPLNPAITDKLAVMAYNVLRTYCREQGPETCKKCMFYKDGWQCLVCDGEAPQDWKEMDAT